MNADAITISNVLSFAIALIGPLLGMRRRAFRSMRPDLGTGCHAPVSRFRTGLSENRFPLFGPMLWCCLAGRCGLAVVRAFLGWTLVGDLLWQATGEKAVDDA